MPKVFNGKRNFFIKWFLNNCICTWKCRWKKWTLTYTSHNTKVNLTWIMDTNTKAKTNFLEEKLEYLWLRESKGASLVSQLVKNLLAMWETWVRNIPWRRERLPIPVFWAGEFHGLCSPWGHRVRHDWATFTFRESEELFRQFIESNNYNRKTSVKWTSTFEVHILKLWISVSQNTFWRKWKDKICVGRE